MVYSNVFRSERNVIRNPAASDRKHTAPFQVVAGAGGALGSHGAGTPDGAACGQASAQRDPGLGVLLWGHGSDAPGPGATATLRAADPAVRWVLARDLPPGELWSLLGRACRSKSLMTALTLQTGARSARRRPRAHPYPATALWTATRTQRTTTYG